MENWLGKVLLLAGAVICATLFLPFFFVLRLASAPPELTPQERVLLWLPAVVKAAEEYKIPSALLLGVMEVESGGWPLAINQNCSNSKPSGWQDCQEVYGSKVRTVSEDAGLMQINSGGWPPPAVPSWKRYSLFPDPINPGLNIEAGAAIFAAALANSSSVNCAAEIYHQGKCQGGSDGGYGTLVEGAYAYYQGAPILAAWTSGGKRDGAYQTAQSSIDLYAVASGPYGQNLDSPPASGGLQVVAPEAVYAEVPGQMECFATAKGERCLQMRWPLQLVTVGAKNVGSSLLFFPGMNVWVGRVNLTIPPSNFNQTASGNIRVIAQWNNGGHPVRTQTLVPVNYPRENSSAAILSLAH